MRIGNLVGVDDRGHVSLLAPAFLANDCPGSKGSRQTGIGTTVGLLSRATSRRTRWEHVSNTHDRIGPDPDRRQRNGVVFAAETEAAGAKLGLRVRRFMIDGPHEFAVAFSAMAADRIGAVVIQPLFVEHRVTLAALALQHRLPAASDQRAYADVGLLLAYGTSRRAIYQKAADYVSKILGGVKPADIPVEQPTRFELVVNLRTANALGLTIPPSVLILADEVIE